MIKSKAPMVGVMRGGREGGERRSYRSAGRVFIQVLCEICRVQNVGACKRLAVPVAAASGHYLDAVLPNILKKSEPTR